VRLSGGLVVVAALSSAQFISACGSGAGSPSTSSGAHSATSSSAGAQESNSSPAPRRALSVATIERMLKISGEEVTGLTALRGALGDYGQPASAADTRAVGDAVKRYYAVAATGDAAKACSMVTLGAMKAILIQYGASHTGSASQGKACETVVSSILKRRRGQLAAPIGINGVLRSGNHAYAIFNSRTMPDSMIALERQPGGWVVSDAIGGTIPMERKRP
jgi:hypothetical protein